LTCICKRKIVNRLENAESQSKNKRYKGI
jgi:hypothetical protein